MMHQTLNRRDDTMTATPETVRALIFGVMTGSTCGDACWHAREEVCRCSCGGRNHGILTTGGARPQRTARIEGQLYELVAVIPGRAEGECWNDAFRRTTSEVSRVIAERFPGLDTYSYGEYREAKAMPVLDRKVSDSQAKWAEVQAVPGAFRLVWARPVGSRYLMRGPNHSCVWTVQNPALDGR
jgi:hypothetical protein